ncbi:MAG: DUF192 domain-containing protein [Candidatus Aenigmarchaeota archaeon]|nr:DUF192 domain-containing protein [Candidatus Aenigmarchaeota archaeon]MDI6722477.1 DUF192 domain-containing protein [Candidatus Aenigmarchaeota archaeon]
MTENRKMKIRGKTFCIKDCRIISSVWGLMFDNMKYVDGALIYGSSVWMPFVKYRLDLFFLDKEMRIISVQKAVPMTINPKTWKSYSCKGAKYCLEMKKGACRARIGEKAILKIQQKTSFNKGPVV